MHFKPKLLYLLTEDSFFCSHFMERALAARAAGYDVVVAARENTQGERIRAAGLCFIAIPFNRSGMNPLRELGVLLKIWKLYRQERPAIVHQVSAKPILYGSLAARLSGVPAVVNAPVGMGYIFSSSDFRARILRPWLRLAYRFFTNPEPSKVIFENPDDLSSFVNWKAVRPADTVLIKGAGVNLDHFQPMEKPEAIPVVVLTARMLRDKGVDEFVSAAHRLYDESVKARFVLVGAPDPVNPTSITIEMLNAWNGRKNVEWWGWREDVAAVLQDAHIVCLPSYREGLPKSLIEAAACGLPIVTTDTTGCREVVDDGKNGFLVPVRDVASLANALKKLILDSGMRQRMGAYSRKKAEAEFSSGQVIRETLAVYSQLVDR
ncbi:glycosyltransferase family 4 protein [Oxalobacter vibrioformis]|uniref:Glycosyltransferase family 4 protein n=1 Tax=Oxalobacter vibrioformis TaxID=933080 RepID=A0A9E9LTY8_9BURK|nr:glycosyltransferase family 4 protein [Oxalobacter vibrioformis]WAW09111.1 glycosyltransferase family 4 protein [Oxalobacter vibrioformis]